MAEPTSRIEPATSYNERESNLPSRRGREKPRPNMKPPDGLAELTTADELDEQEKHSLDTLA
ncbi:MAG: hypothetical protein ACRD5K_01080 [Candidatus Acidiferrales bacterium]